MMAVNARPYLLTYKGETHIVEATSPAAAIQHVVGDDVTDLRAAKGRDVMQWVRDGKTVEQVGVKPEPLPLIDLPKFITGKTADDTPASEE